MCFGGVLSLKALAAATSTAAATAIERSIHVVSARRLLALAGGVLALFGLASAPAPAARGVLDLAPLGRHLHARDADLHARDAAGHGPSVGSALLALEHSGAISEAAYSQYASAEAAANRSLGRLSGTRRAELGAVLANIQAIAAAGELTASRLPALYLTLERNRQWWTSEPMLSGDQRLSFPPSKIVWEHYPGQGIEIQWLATFGEANGYYLSNHENGNLRQLLGEVIPLATKRGGGIAWEYLFQFDGGLPPWTSGLSQGTALQVLARAWSRFKEAAYLTAAQQALGVFQTPPPQGVRVPTPAGALYAEYTYAPNDKILNGFIQALVGLYDYTSITGDPLGLALFEAGDAEARALVPDYDTGAWSRYDQFGESNLNYHELLTEFLQHLCQRTRHGPPLAPAGAPSSPPAGSTGEPAPPSAAGGTAATAAVRAGAAQAAQQIPGDQIYCTTAQQFTVDLHTPPAMTLLTKTLAGGTRAGVQLALSKISTVTLTVRQGTRVVWSTSATVEHGDPRLLWVTPAAGGTFSVTLAATDLAGNFSTTSGTIVVHRR